MSASTAERTNLGVILLPLLLVAAAIWHGFSTGVYVGHDHLPEGRSVATWWFAADLAGQGANPYDPEALQAAARQAGRQARVPRLFAPPQWVAAMSWTASRPVAVAWGTWLALHEVLFLGAIALLWRDWQPRGRAPRLTLVAFAAATGAVPVALDLGTPTFALLVLMWSSFRTSNALERGVLLGLAGAVSLRAFVVLPLWIARREWTTLGAALATWVASLGGAAVLLGPEAVRGFFDTALPAMLSGDFTGLNLRIDVFGNQAPTHLWATLFPGTSGQQLSPIALALTWSVGIVAAGALAWAHREPGDRDLEAAAWLCAVVALPVYGHEALVPLALPALALVLTGVWRGAIDAQWAVPLGVAAAFLAYPVDPLRELYTDVFLPDLPWVAPALREVKPAALLAISGFAVAMSLRAPKDGRLAAQ